MKEIMEKGGILAQIPVMIFVLFYFPNYGTDWKNQIVHVNTSFYVIQTILCLLPVVQHVLFMVYKDKYDSSTQWNIIRVFFIVSFFLTVWNCYRFQ
jgi:hypothetical protein